MSLASVRFKFQTVHRRLNTHISNTVQSLLSLVKWFFKEWKGPHACQSYNTVSPTGWKARCTNMTVPFIISRTWKQQRVFLWFEQTLNTSPKKIDHIGKWWHIHSSIQTQDYPYQLSSTWELKDTLEVTSTSLFRPCMCLFVPTLVPLLWLTFNFLNNV